MACHSFKRTQANPLYLPEILISLHAESLTQHAGGMGVSLTAQGCGPDSHALLYQSGNVVPVLRCKLCYSKYTVKYALGY